MIDFKIGDNVETYGGLHIRGIVDHITPTGRIVVKDSKNRNYQFHPNGMMRTSMEEDTYLRHT